MTSRTELRLWRDLTEALAQQAVARRHLESFATGDAYRAAIHRSAELIAGVVTARRTISLTLTFPVDVKRLIEQALGVTYDEKEFDEEFGFLVRTIGDPRGRTGTITQRCSIFRIETNDHSSSISVNRWLRTQGQTIAPFYWMLALHRRYPKLWHGPRALPARFKRGRRDEWRMGSDASSVGWRNDHPGDEKYFVPASDPTWGLGTLVLTIPRKQP